MSNGKDTVKAAVEDLIIGFGVLEGLWIYAGMNPLVEVLEAFAPFIADTQFAWYPVFVRFLIFFLVPLLQILAVYGWGGVIGLLALLLAFLGGIFIGGMPGILMAFAGVGLGYYSFANPHKVTFSDVVVFISDIIDYFKK